MALALARVVLQAPDWVIFDDTFSSMEDETLERIIDVFTRDLTRTTIIHIGRSAQAHLPLFTRVLHLTRLPGEADQEEQWATERLLRRGR
jgi:putative ATP-binding cassette transporter